MLSNQTPSNIPSVHRELILAAISHGRNNIKATLTATATGSVVEIARMCSKNESHVHVNRYFVLTNILNGLSSRSPATFSTGLNTRYKYECAWNPVFQLITLTLAATPKESRKRGLKMTRRDTFAQLTKEKAYCDKVDKVHVQNNSGQKSIYGARDPFTFHHRLAQVVALPLKTIEGENLYDFLKSPRITRLQQYGLAESITKSLMEVHAAKVVHRDIKPENIMVTANFLHNTLTLTGTVIDFGFGKIKNENVFEGVGSPLFACPESLKSQARNKTSDIYSLALVFICIFFGFDLREVYVAKMTGIYDGRFTPLSRGLITHWIEKFSELERKDLLTLIKEYSGITELTTEQLNLIKLLQSMCSPNPADRPDGSDILITLNDILKKYFINQIERVIENYNKEISSGLYNFFSHMGKRKTEIAGINKIIVDYGNDGSAYDHMLTELIRYTNNITLGARGQSSLQHLMRAALREYQEHRGEKDNQAIQQSSSSSMTLSL